MKKISVLLLLLTMMLNLSAQSKKEAPANVKITWELKENNYKNEFKFLSAFIFENTGKKELPAKGWTLYFNLPRMIDAKSVTNNIRIEHINGDYYKLFPGDGFKGLAKGASVTIDFIAGDWATNYSDAPSGLFMVFDSEPSQAYAASDYVIKPFTTDKQLKRWSGDKLGKMTAELQFQKNSGITAQNEAGIIPRPASITAGNGTLTLDKIQIVFQKGLQSQANYLSKSLAALLPAAPAVQEGSATTAQQIGLSLGHNGKPESYKLTIDASGIRIQGADAAGVFYGIQSLKALVPGIRFKEKSASLSWSYTTVVDGPRYAYRGMELDVARNFRAKEDVLRLLEVMSFYKLNKFHFHITDDEGWRIEIPGLPELTELGSKRGYSNNNTSLYPSFGSGGDIATSAGTGFYTRNDFIEILKFAAERHIEVIPEVDMPGHSRAAIKAMDLRYQRKMKEGNKEEAEKYLLSDLKDSSKYMSVQQWKDNVVCICQTSTYNFFEKIVTELGSMYKESGQKLKIMHVGGDEVPGGVWEKSPNCDALRAKNPELKDLNNLLNYYYTNLSTTLAKQNVQLAGWEEVGLLKTKVNGSPLFIPNPEFVDNKFISYVWNNVWGWGSEDLAYRMANAGYPVVLSNATNLYFDLAYDKWAEEPGYYWAGYCDLPTVFAFAPEDYYRGAREDRMGNPVDKSIFVGKDKLTDYGKQNIIGMQGQLWSENLTNKKVFEYLLLPKLLALAERAWSPVADWETNNDATAAEAAYKKDWNRFVNIVGKNELPRLDYYNGGYGYRLPPPGAQRKDGAVEANIQLPGLTIRYTTDGTEPTASSPAYTAPIKSTTAVKLRSFDTKGRGGMTVEVK